MPYENWGWWRYFYGRLISISHFDSSCSMCLPLSCRAYRFIFAGSAPISMLSSSISRRGQFCWFNSRLYPDWRRNSLEGCPSDGSASLQFPGRPILDWRYGWLIYGRVEDSLYRFYLPRFASISLAYRLSAGHISAQYYEVRCRNWVTPQQLFYAKR